jgi:hypothetical protein
VRGATYATKVESVKRAVTELTHFAAFLTFYKKPGEA